MISIIINTLKHRTAMATRPMIAEDFLRLLDEDEIDFEEVCFPGNDDEVSDLEKLVLLAKRDINSFLITTVSMNVNVLLIWKLILPLQIVWLTITHRSLVPHTGKLIPGSSCLPLFSKLI